MLKNYYTTFDIKEADETDASIKKKIEVQRTWQRLYDDQNSIFHQVASDPAVKHVVFHCYQSSSRTPPIARSYWQFMRGRGGRDENTLQKVYVLAGGYQAYSQWVNNSKYSDGREEWK